MLCIRSDFAENREFFGTWNANGAIFEFEVMENSFYSTVYQLCDMIVYDS